jgi:hypothetical protein
MDNLIDDYVVDYLKSLKEVAQDIIFVSDCEIDQNEQKKLDGLVQKSICKKHGEYDFGSYKIGLFAVKEELKNYDQLIMANDSCYLISSLVPVFEEMKNREIKGFDFDFWGMIQNQDQYPVHLQSYFIIFKKNVFSHKAFYDFFENVKLEQNKKDIIEKYEIGLTQKLLEQGFHMASFIKKIFENNPTCSNKIFTELFPKGFPFLKIEALTSSSNDISNKNKSRLETKLKDKVIKKHLQRIVVESSTKNTGNLMFKNRLFYLSIKNKVLRFKIFQVRIIKINLS